MPLLSHPELEVRQLRHHFGPFPHAFLSSSPLHTCRVVDFTSRACFSDADRCLQSDGVPNSRLQVKQQASCLLATMTASFEARKLIRKSKLEATAPMVALLAEAQGPICQENAW